MASNGSSVFLLPQPNLAKESGILWRDLSSANTIPLLLVVVIASLYIGSCGHEWFAGFDVCEVTSIYLLSMSEINLPRVPHTGENTGRISIRICAPSHIKVPFLYTVPV